MSEFLDELARAVSRPMPRSRAVRVLGVAVASLAVPMLRPSRAGARRSGTLRTSCHKLHCPQGHPPDPRDPLTLTCKCNEKPIQGVGGEITECNFICCDPKHDQCDCKPGSAGCKACDVPCGGKCCREGEFCASPRRSICCRKGESVCLVLGTPGTAQKGTGGRCCPERTQCCANNKRSTCCPTGDTCCAGRCCPPEKRCNPRTGDCRCPTGTETCGRDCCKSGKKPEKCCGDHCCTSTQTCCGQTCCDRGEQCCGSKCCKTSEKETCCGEAGCCNKDEVCMTTTQRLLQGSRSRSSARTIGHVCCPKPRAFGKEGCCPPGTRASSPDGIHRTCCPPGNPDCCDPPCLPGTICVNGTCKAGL